MIAKSLSIVVAAALLAVTTAAAEAKSRKRHKPPKIVHVAPAPVSEYEAMRQRALLLFGGCVTDEGYGRFNPCDRARPD